MRLLLGLAAVAGIPSSLLGQQLWARQVDARLERAIDAVSRSSGGMVVKQTGVLNTDESATLRTPLSQGIVYTIVAVCDDDCSRLQLTLLTTSGSEIAKERNSESLPSLHFTPAATQPYGIRVVMEGCRLNPCWYAVAIVPVAKSPS
jgi:hypothetical protein